MKNNSKELLSYSRKELQRIDEMLKSTTLKGIRLNMLKMNKKVIETTIKNLEKLTKE